MTNKNIRFSQNFLKSRDLVKSLVSESSITPSDTVYEIGPGRGIITAELIKKSKKVIAIEADQKLHERLQETFSDTSNLSLIFGDFLAEKLSTRPYKIFSNIPFNRTSEIIRKLFEGDNPPSDSYLFLQREAALKIGGKLLGGRETQLSTLLMPWFETEVVYRFKRSDFSPIPAVDVVLLRLNKREKPLISKDSRSEYRDFVFYGFNSFKENLKKGFEDIFSYAQFKRLAKDLDFSLKALPSELDSTQWLGLFNYYNNSVDPKKRLLVKGTEEKQKFQHTGIIKINRTSIAKDWLGK